MNRKEIIMIGSMIGGLSTSSFEGQKAQSQEKIFKTFSLREGKGNSKKEKILDLQKENETSVISVNISDLEGTPLWGSKKMIQPNYGNLLGFSQAENIMRDYNGLPDSVEFSATKRLESKDKIRFPLIYPELEGYFPKERETLCLNESFSKYQDIKAAHLLVVSRCENGKNALAYYERGKLKLATYVSIGKPGTKTITGSFPLKHSAIFRRSRKYKNAAMPYAIHIEGGYFLHQGRSDGKPRSHGCVRAPGLYQKRIYEHLTKTTPDENSKKIGVPTIILEGLYTPTLSPLHSKKKDSHTETTSFQ